MATISTSQSLDSAARSAGEAMTINSNATLTINTDTRYHKNAPAAGAGSLGSFTMTDATGGEVLLEGRYVRWLSFGGATGLVPPMGSTITGISAQAELLGIYAGITNAPGASGTAMPSSGFVKFKSILGQFGVSEYLVGLSAITTSIDKTGWIEVVLDDAANITIGRAQKFSVRGDWFYLDDTIGGTQIVQLPTCGGGVNTRYPGIWIENGVGTSVFEFWPAQRTGYSLASGWYSTAKGTDVLSKYVEMREGGAVGIGTGITNNYGYIPPSGCKIRIPNILCQHCATGSRASNSLPNATVATRPEFTTTNAGVLDIDGCLSNWYFNIVQPYAVTIKNTATLDSAIIQEVATAFELNDFNNGNYLNTDVNALTFTSNLAGGTITNCNWGRCGTMASADYGVYVNYCYNLTFNDCSFHNRIFRTNAAAYPVYVAYCDNVRFYRPKIIGGALSYAVSTNNYVEDPVYADNFHTFSNTTTPPTGVVNINAGCVGSVIKGGAFWPGLSNVHPDTNYLYVTGSFDTRWYDCGTTTVPIDGGVSNQMLYAINDAGSNSNIELKRVYFTNIATSFVTSVNSTKGLKLENCQDDYAGTNTAFDALDGIVKGFQIAAADTAFTSVYGTIFYNIFTGTTVGRMGLMFNEPTSTYSSYVSTAGLTGKAGFDSTGNLYLYTAGDYITYEFPYYAKGYTAFSNTTPTLSGSGTSSLYLQYDIDTGGGFGSTWKNATGANLSGETINYYDGVKVKIRIGASATAAQSVNTMYFTMVTDSTIQKEQYPLDEYTVTLTGLQTGTKVAVLTTGTETLLELLTVSGGQVSYTYPDTSVGNGVDFAILAPGYLYQKVSNYILTAADASVPIVQNTDYGYNALVTATVTFNGSTKRIICNAGTTSINVVGVYTEWVKWALTGNNLQYNAAFSELGGNTIDSGAGTYVPVYGFLVNNWRISPDETDHTLSVTGGIVLVSGGGDPFVDTAGDYVVRINYQQPVQAITVSTGGGGGATAQEVWEYTSRTLSALGISQIQNNLATMAGVSANSGNIMTGIAGITTDLTNVATVSGLSTNAQNIMNSVAGITVNLSNLATTAGLSTNAGNIMTGINGITVNISNLATTAGLSVNADNIMTEISGLSFGGGTVDNDAIATAVWGKTISAYSDGTAGKKLSSIKNQSFLIDGEIIV